MPQSALTSTTQAGLRMKLDGIVSQMIDAGESDSEIQAVVDDFKSRHYVNQPEPAPSFLDLAGTALKQGAKNLVMAPVNLARTVADVARQPEASGAMLGPALVRRLIVDPAIAQGQQAVQAGREGRYSEAAGHGLAAALPLVGPASVEIGQKIGTGHPRQIAEATGDLGALVAAPPVMRLSGRAITAAGRGAQHMGTNAWLRAAKITEPVAKKTEAYRKSGGDFPSAEAEIAETVLSRGKGAITRKNVNALRSERAATGQKIGEITENSPVEIPTSRLLSAMDDEIATMTAEAAPSSHIRQATSRRNELADQWENTATVEVPSPVAQTLKTAAYERQGPQFGKVGQPPPPGLARMDKAMARAIKVAQDELIPGLKEANYDFSKVKPAATAMGVAQKRIGHHDPLSLAQQIVAGSTAGLSGVLAAGPMGLAAAAVPAALMRLNRGVPLSRVGQSLYTRGKQMQPAGAGISNANQAALIAQLIEQAREDE